MSERAITASIASQKGGVGKTSNTMLLLSLMHAGTTLRICAIDIDPQLSLTRKRTSELMEIETGSNPPLARAFEDLKTAKKGIFDIIPIDLNDQSVKESMRSIVAEQKFDQIVNSGKYDLVFVDFPGLMMEAKFLRILAKVDYVFVPVRIDDLEIAASNEYIESVQELIELSMGVKNMAAFSWAHEAGKPYQESIDDMAAYFKEKGVHFLENKIPFSKEIRNKKSTINPFDLRGDKSVYPLMEEILDFIKKDTKKRKK